MVSGVLKSHAPGGSSGGLPNTGSRVFLGFCILALAALVLLPPDFGEVTDGKLIGVGVLKPSLNAAIWYAGAASFLVMLVLPPVAGKVRFGVGYWACPVAALVAFPMAAMHRVTHSLAPWIVCDTCHGPDGETYVFMNSSFLQGQTLALGRVKPDGWLYKRFDVLGDTNGDSPRSYALIVRPVDRVRSNGGQLHLSDDNVLLGLRHDNRCYFAYDFRADRFLGHGDIDAISPFLLIRPDSRLVRVDVDSLLTSRGVPAVDGIGMLPSESALRDALAHQNPSVRDLASRLLESAQSH